MFITVIYNIREATNGSSISFTLNIVSEDDPKQFMVICRLFLQRDGERVYINENSGVK